MSNPRTPVRRRLFPSIVQAIEEGQIDNVANVLQEEIRRDKSEASTRWGFDFEHERPIPGGQYHWVRIDSHGQEEDFEEDSGDVTAEEELQSTADTGAATDFDTGTTPIEITKKEFGVRDEHLVQNNSATLTKDNE